MCKQSSSRGDEITCILTFFGGVYINIYTLPNSLNFIGHHKPNKIQIQMRHGYD